MHVRSPDLDWLTGDWKVEKHYQPNPFLHGHTLTEAEHCAWAVGGYFVICDSTDVVDKGKPVREIVSWSQDTERHVLRFVDITPNDRTDQPVAGWCRIEDDVWYCYTEPRLENGKTIKLRFVQKNTVTSATGNSLFSEEGRNWLPLSEDWYSRIQ